MSHLADMVATGPCIFNAIPTEKMQDVIYVKRVGMLEWFDASDDIPSGYRSPVQDERIGFFLRRTAPRGWLKANGAAVLVAAYVDLCADIYCGDENNANADWGYRCTNPTAPSATRSITGAYMVLPDLRGEFIRGWDDARGIDALRIFGSSQISTQVLVDDDGGQVIGAIDWTNNNLPALGYEAGNPTSLISYHLVNATYASPTNVGSSFIRSIRPRNVALLACIKI